ncbi:hypothetical protein NC652_001632 [Populus alba x Populus x berolinensis]|nr:hypothetical protein NC652_001632 [Populus alba x Populus x berolinensis]
MRQTSRQSYTGVGDGVVAASAFGVVLCVHLKSGWKANWAFCTDRDCLLGLKLTNEGGLITPH